VISINNLEYHIGGRAIFRDTGLHIHPRERIGLIGLNGTGKTTLLRIINGEYTPDAGDVTISNECSLGFLNQDLLSYESEQTILDVAMEAFAEAVHLHHEIDQTIKQLEHDYDEGLVSKLTRLQEKYETLEGYSLQAKAEEILEGVGFKTADLERPYNQFSGGWRMRVMLAKLLLQKPALLMLDEPTNHLDLPSIQWLENYLNNYEGAYIIVSHDKRFLDQTVMRIVEVEGKALVSYSGNYSQYLEQKSERRELQMNAYKNQQQQIRQTERFIERFRAKSTKARQVQSKIKAMDKMERIEEVVESDPTVNFRFEIGKSSGKIVKEIKGMSKSYGNIKIFDDANAYIERGDKIALIGANGKGKSTLLRIIAGTESHSGKSQEGYNVVSSFYAQHQLEALSVENDMLTEMKQTGTTKTEQELRTVLGCFLFHDDDVFKKIKVLSGGEKSRVALAKTLISEANFLILDEPTNHLDMQSVNILIQALQQYQGTFILVSHDRYFISEVANKIWYIDNKKIKEYPGNYEEYEYWLKQQNTSQSTKTPVKAKEKKKDKKTGKSANRSPDQKKLKKLQNEMEKIEGEIDNLENEKSVIEENLEKPEVLADYTHLQKWTEKYHRIEKRLKASHEKWEELAEKIDNIEEKIGAAQN